MQKSGQNTAIWSRVARPRRILKPVGPDLDGRHAMLDGLSLDQLRIFLAAADEGSFSAASRKLLRAQSVISQAVSALEKQLGVALFDRTARYPRLTVEGVVLLSDARAVMARIDALKARAKGISGGLEAELSIVIDVMFPITAVTKVAKDFAESFPDTSLRLYIDALGGVAKRVLEGRCGLGIVGSLPDIAAPLQGERLLGMRMVMVAAPEHPLAKVKGAIPRADLMLHTQIVLTDRTDFSAGRDFGVMSPNTWKLSDLGAKHAFLLAGLGWGAMPIAAIDEDLSAGRLVVLLIEDEAPGGMILPMFMVHKKGAPPGPAGRWFIDTLRVCAAAHDPESKSSPPP